MRGSPIILTALLALALLLAGLPVWTLTRPHEHSEPAPPSVARPTATTRPLELNVATTSPATIELRHSGQLVWSSPVPADSFTTTLPAPPDAADFVATIRGLDGSKQNAARFQFSHDGDTLADTTLWGEQTTEDVIPVPAAAP
jgi:hypothetical protein